MVAFAFSLCPPMSTVDVDATFTAGARTAITNGHNEDLSLTEGHFSCVSKLLLLDKWTVSRLISVQRLRSANERGSPFAGTLHRFGEMASIRPFTLPYLPQIKTKAAVIGPIGLGTASSPKARAALSAMALPLQVAHAALS